MTRERWEDLLERLRARFPDLTTERSALTPGPGTVDRVLVPTPAGTIKLELTERPRLLRERGVGSHRIGSSVVLERQYDEHETSLTFKAYRQSLSGDWTELDPSAIP